MKKLLYVLPLSALFIASCGGATTEDTPFDDGLNSEENLDASVHSFADGEAATGEDYFFGVLAEVIAVDVKFNEVAKLDEMDAEVTKFNEVIDSGLILITNARKAMDLYKDKTWPKRQELHDITLEWFSTIEALFNNHLKPLAAPMATPDEDWTDAQTKLYDDYIVALEAYYEVDNRWVDFQYEYASANGFELDTENFIDVDALVDEDMESTGH